MKITIWHNNRCSTSREVLQFLIGKGLDIQIRNYLEDPPEEYEIIEVLKKMNRKADYILRRKEPLFQKEYALKNYRHPLAIKWMVKHPELIERPILITAEKAYLGRPLNEFKTQFVSEIESSNPP